MPARMPRVRRREFLKFFAAASLSTLAAACRQRVPILTTRVPGLPTATAAPSATSPPTSAPRATATPAPSESATPAPTATSIPQSPGYLPPQSVNMGDVAADYYVDSVNGSDANNGRSPLEAFASLSRVKKEVIEAGITIGLAAGSIWYDNLDFSDPLIANLTVQGYGTGPLPQVIAGQILSDFSKSNDFDNIYESEITAELHPGGSSLTLLAEDDRLLRRRDTLAEVDAEPGTYLTSIQSLGGRERQDVGNGDTTFTVYVHPFSSGDPNDDGSLYRASRYLRGICAGDNALVRFVWTGLASGNSGSIRVGDGSTVQFAAVEFGNKHHLFVGENALVEDCWLWEAEPPYTGTFLVHNKDQATGGDVTYRRVKMGCAAYVSRQAGLFGHRNQSGTFGAVLFEDCEVTNCGHVVTGPRNFRAFAINRGQFFGCGSLLSANDTGTHTIDGVRFYGHKRGQHAANLISFTGERAEIVMRNCELYPSWIGVAAITNIAAGSTLRIETSVVDARNNVEAANCILMHSDDRSAAITITECAFPAFETSYRFVQNPGTLESDFNEFALESRFFYDGTWMKGLAAWQAASGEDAHSVTL